MELKPTEIALIVIAIVGILAAIALPAYQDYIVRSKMSEPLAALAEAKTTIAEYVAANGEYPTSSSSFGINTTLRSAQSEIVEQIVVTDNLTVNDTVYVTALVDACTWDGSGCEITAATNTAEFSLSGSTNADGTMSWDCVPGGGAGTAVATQYLPANCRGG